ncbi:acyl-CoA dehydrogenase family protein [Nocardioides sp. AN3]
MFEPSDRAKRFRDDLQDFMDAAVYPAEPVYEAQMHASGDPHFHPPVLEDLKSEAKRRGLWNLFHPHPDWGPGLSNLDYAHLCEILGRSPHLAPEATNCSAPDTGNMEVLTLFGTEEHQQRYLRPLLEGTIRSAFAMTEPAVASSDATNIELRMVRDGDAYVLNGRKWFASNALHANCRVLIVMGKTDPDAATHRQQSMMVVPIDAPGVTIVRGLPVFGYQDREGHAEILFEDVRVPVSDVLAGEGEGFAISQARLGPGRIHHCMRAIGMAERALELLCRRALGRATFGVPIAERSNIQDWIAEARIDIEKSRLLTLKAAWMMDHVGNKAARTEIAAIKVDAPSMALRIVDRAIQVHGAAGVTDDVPLANFWAHLRTLRLADGPDEVHKRAIARQELRKYSVSTASVLAGSR